MNPRDDLLSGVRTVRQMADYFRELKARASELVATGEAWQRGYFTPSEDLAIRWLLISYWQSRNALLDLVSTLRRDLETLDDESRPLGFLVAFSGALLLVDAARFLRDVAEPRPHLQAKLNEAAPEFGIPAGVYDHVQRSLFSARHAWHMYHAVRYYEWHRESLRATAAAVGASDVADLADELLHRAQVSTARYLQARWRTRGGRIVRRFTSDLLRAALYGLQKLGGTLVADKYVRVGHKPRLPSRVARQVQALLEPGDVLVVRKEYAVTNYFLPGYWPHAALYLGTPDQCRRLNIERALQEGARPAWRRFLEGDTQTPGGTVLEAMRDGVLLRSLASPFGSDSIVVLRPCLTSDQIGSALARGLLHEGKPYDFDFDFRRSDRLVCTEVAYRAFEGVGGLTFPLVRRAGRPTLSGGDLIQLAVEERGLRPVAAYAPRIAATDEVVTGQRACAVLRAGQTGDSSAMTPAGRDGDSP